VEVRLLLDSLEGMIMITTESKDKATLESERREYEKFTLAKTKFDEANIVCSDLISEMKAANF
jgi:hypothetical protein